VKASVDVQVVGGHATLWAHGEFDIDSSRTLGQALAAVTETGLNVTLDLSDVAFLDASGLGQIAAAQATLNERGCRLVVANASGIVRRVFEVTNMTRVLIG
jgi:anti-sigma B factor antagonist